VPYYRKYRMVIHVVHESEGKEIVFNPDAVTQFENVRVAPHGNLVIEQKKNFHPDKTASELVSKVLCLKKCTAHFRKEEGLLKTVCLYTALVFVDEIKNSQAIKGYSTDFLHYFQDCRYIT